MSVLATITLSAREAADGSPEPSSYASDGSTTLLVAVLVVLVVLAIAAVAIRLLRRRGT